MIISNVKCRRSIAKGGDLVNPFVTAVEYLFHLTDQFLGLPEGFLPKAHLLTNSTIITRFFILPFRSARFSFININRCSAELERCSLLALQALTPDARYILFCNQSSCQLHLLCSAIKAMRRKKLNLPSNLNPSQEPKPVQTQGLNPTATQQIKNFHSALRQPEPKGN